MSEKLKTFQGENVSFNETMTVKDGVICDTYDFKNDAMKDLGVVFVESGKSTPLQKVVYGDSTIEGYLSGVGSLTVCSGNGEESVYIFPHDSQGYVEVKIGETMQWRSDDNLVFYEICTPPYSDGRFEDIGERA